MEICSEHGEDIAYVGRECPACVQVESLEQDHRIEMDDLEDDMRVEIDHLQQEIDEHECK